MVKKTQSTTSSLSFKTKLLKASDYIIVRLPESESKKLPSRGQVMVKGRINGHDLRQVLEPDGRWGHWFKLNDKLLKVLGLSAGDSVAIEAIPSKDWPEPTVPKDFLKALNTASASVKELWTKITPMARWEWIRWVNATSVTETRDRRIDVSISKLQSGKRRPCCFNLAACTDPDLSNRGMLVESV